ncbi:hypothetical protein ABZ924_08210 [Streptomyces sp. NPDC046876]|uniref:hypothetical protein n=1 Tax=Streptomyces sp. NPDC046876 TaxID=3155616 RepID=UPI0033E9F788
MNGRAAPVPVPGPAPRVPAAKASAPAPVARAASTQLADELARALMAPAAAEVRSAREAAAAPGVRTHHRGRAGGEAAAHAGGRRAPGPQRGGVRAEEAPAEKAGAEPAEPGAAEHSGPGADPGDLIILELAEHERWADSFGGLGTAGTDARARYLLDMAGQGAAAGAAGGAVTGFAMSAIGAAVGQIAARRLATMAVSRGLSAAPVPGLGPAIGGLMAIVGLAGRDWSATGRTVGRIGTGTGYERLANDLEGLAELLDVATALMDVVGGVLGGIAVGMWVGAVLSGGTLAPLALTLSAVATAMGLATTAVGLITNATVRPVVTALRALHAFESQADPAGIEEQGRELSAAAGQVTGAVAGALAAKAGARAGTAGGNRLDRGITRLQQRATGGALTPSVTSPGGPRLHVEMPEAPGPAPAPHTAPTSGTSVHADPATTVHADPATGSGGAVHADPGTGSGTTVHGDPGTSSGATAQADAGSGAAVHVDPAADTGTATHADPAAGTGGATRDDPGTGAARPAAHGPAPLHDPADFSDLGPLVRSLDEDPVVRARLTDERPELPRRAVPWTRREARAHANRQAADHREATGMTGDVVEAGHTAAARHAAESGIREQDWNTQQMQPLHSRRDPALAVTVTHQDGRQSTNTRHNAQERLINAATDHSRAAAEDSTLGPRGQLDASDLVVWQAENVPLAQDNVELLRSGGHAPPERGAPVDPATGRVIPGQAPAPASPAGPAPAPPPAASASPAPTAPFPPTQDRAAAMAQYRAQVQADPARESGVWLDSAGNYHVMQGGAGSVAPPSGVPGPLHLVYHSHPTTADPAMRVLNSRPSQAGGDFYVLQYQHGEGSAGRRQVSELHFPVYAADGSHSGYGATQFAYDPTHPLPLHVSTTLPGGRSTTVRYRDFADYQRRARVGAGGATPAERAAAFAHSEERLRTDRAEAALAVEGTARGLRPAPGVLGVREGREQGRQDGDRAAAGSAEPARSGPAYTARAAGLRPGESVEIPVNPAYRAPPGTRAELAALRERIALTRQAQAELARTEGRMAGQAAVQRGQDDRLERAGGLSQHLVEGGRAQAAATGTTRSANREQQATAGGAVDRLGRSAQQAGAVATLVGSLRAFQGLAHLFGYLPGSLGDSARGARADSARLIAALGRVTETDAARHSMEAGRSDLRADETRIGTVEQSNRQTAGELDRGRRQVDELRARNQERLGETEATGQQARQERRAAAGDEVRTRAAHDDLLVRMQAWAAEHRAARERAVASARARLTAQGYRVRETR